jgi:trk system potassium uptake protein TrkH
VNREGPSRTFKHYLAILLSPQRTLILSFLFLILIGTVALSLPFSTHTDEIDFIDVLFTATSAICVTGLTVVDTGRFFSLWGQGIILVLIQMGGLGIMTFSVFFYRLLGGDISVRDRMVIQDTFTYAPVRDIFYIVRTVFAYTIVIEAIGTGLLFLWWLPHYQWGSALYLALFHAVSAFCNAGFTLLEGSLTAYRDNPFINGTVIALIILGGIGFVVLHELRRWVAKRSPLSLHTKVVLVTTAALIFAGTALFFLVERGNTVAGLGLGESLLISLFQSVTARTAGFNTVNFGQLTNVALFIFIILMFFGASPGSCGGGVKTTNFAILFITAWNRFLGRRDVHLFKRTLPGETITRSISVLALSLLLITVVLILLNIVQGEVVSHSESRGLFLELFFEATSAFGTVGLSTGLTHAFKPLSKILITVTMFVGWLGPLTLAFALAQRGGTRRFQYSEENIMVG